MVVATCALCDSATLPDAHYCHSCGVALGAEVVQLGPPERRNSSRPTTKGGLPQRMLVAVSAVVLLAVTGLVLFAGGDVPNAATDIPVAPSPPQAPTQQALVPVAPDSAGTDATAPAAAGQEPTLAWERDIGIGESLSVSLVDFAGNLYMFTARTSSLLSAREAGLNAWVSEDGDPWQSLGTVIDPPHSVFSVSATPGGLVALGNHQGSDLATVWLSQNGIDWTESTLPFDQLGLDPPSSWVWGDGPTPAPVPTADFDRLGLLDVVESLDPDYQWVYNRVGVGATGVAAVATGLGMDVEISQSEQSDFTPRETTQVLLLSADPAQWSTHSFDPSDRPFTTVDYVQVTADRVIAVVSRVDAASRLQRGSPMLEIWSAPIP